MSVRAIAKLLGVGIATVHREMVRSAQDGISGELESRPSTLGRDGKAYRRDRRPTRIPCLTCGEIHLDATADCPWDLFAQGRGPHPGGGGFSASKTDDVETNSLSPEPPASKIRRQTRKTAVNDRCGPPHGRSPESSGGESGAQAVGELVGRLEELLNELGRFASMVTTLETVAIVELSSFTDDFGPVAARIHQLVADLNDENVRRSDLIDRLRRVADVLQAPD